MEATSILVELPIDDYEYIETWVDVDYEVINGQSDVGIFCNYPEIINIHIPREIKGSKVAVAHLKSNETYNYLETQLMDEVR